MQKLSIADHTISRRTMLSGGAPTLVAASAAAPHLDKVERWDIWEQAFLGPRDGNPFVDVAFWAEFRNANRVLQADGFYDGSGLYRIRFMPDAVGEWTFLTHSSVQALDGKSGKFVCTAASNGNHGPVQVRDAQHLCYADGVSHVSIGTTCYAWVHQGDELERQTLATLKKSPFNKLRMCVLPTEKSPRRIPFERNASGAWDHTRFYVPFFQNLDRRIGDLRALGVEADLILFHPYDHDGFQRMTAAENRQYLRYMVARYAAYRNVWWSLANEYDLVKTKTLPNWDEFFRIVQEADPAGHLRSIHYSRRFYDYSKNWVTHLSLQSDDFEKSGEWLAEFRKPILFDECKYEGNIGKRWGNLTGQEMTRRFWLGMSSGAYVGHGETYSSPSGVAWLSKGGTLVGESPARIAFLKKIWEEGPSDVELTPEPYYPFVCKPGSYYLYFFDLHQPAEYEFKLTEGVPYRADVIDIWNMTITPIAGAWRGSFTLPLPGKPFQAVRLRRMDS